MDQTNNSKVDKHFIYGIFRACRLCGAGAGYKMPIIQNVIDVDGEEVELKQKIRECVHIEVHQDDKMPPLICELCVDKVNDFYEFLEMCRQTNKRTRKILGLPLSSKKGAVSSDDCILGVTEPVYVNEDSNEPLSKSSLRNAKQKAMPARFKKVEVKLTPMENISKHHKSAKLPPMRKRSPSPPPRTSSAKPHSKRQRSPSPPPRNSSAKPHSKRQRSPSPPPRTGSRHPLTRQSSPSPRLRTSSAKQPSTRQRSPSPRPRTSSAKQPLRRQRSPSPPPRNSSVKQSLRRQRSPSPPPRTSSAKQPQKRQRSPTPPPRITRHSRGSNEDNQSLSSLKSKRTTRQSSPVTPPPKSILKKEPKIEEKPVPKPKRAPEPPKPAVPQKKVKLSVQSPPAPAPKPPPITKCNICKYQSTTPQATANHLRIHTATYTSEKLACNACREWFTSLEEAVAHHNRRHKARNRAYLCRSCDERYDTYHSYQAHASNHKCVPWEEVPDVKCMECWKYFPTNNVRDAHKCAGVDARPGGKCAKCNRPYALQKNLKKHESTCTAKRRSDYIDPALLSKVRPIQVRVARCDPLLQRVSNGRYDVSDVQDYGLDPTRVYPYIYSAKLNFNRMVNIKSDLDFYCDEDYIHWDSEISDDEDERFLEREKKVPSLTTLALKTLFSQKYLGRVPRKKRKMKSEKSLFDVIMSTDFDIDMSRDIDNIIDNLGDDDNDDSAVNYNEKYTKNDDELDESVEKDNNISKESVKNEDSACDTDLSQDKEDSSVATENKESVNEKNDVEDSNENGKKEETSKNDGNVEKTDEETTDMKENTGESVRENEIKESTDSKVDKESNKRDTEQVNDASELSANTDSVSESLENKKADTNLSENLNQAEVDISNKDINENNDNVETDSDKIKDEISKDDKNEQNNTNLDLVDTDKEKSNTKNHNVGTINTNSNDGSQNKEDKIETNDDNVQQINNQLNEKSETNVHKTDDINDANIHKENNKTETSTGDKTPIDANDADKNINGVDEKSDKLNMEDFKDVCDSEIDDAKLMKDLNEHIGETDEKPSEPTDSSDAKGSNDKNDKAKITLEGVVAKKDSDARSMDLDSISDEEFNFDN